MRKLKRWTAALLCAVLLLGLLPTAALAADGGWAQSAVDTLNGIYQTSVFSTDDTAPMTVGDARMVLTAMGSSDDALTGGEGDRLTRAMACEVLADAFSLSIPAGRSAIAYLYENNIINGVGDGNLNETGSVTLAQFAVLTYRILNHTGGGMGSSIAGLKPGTDEFYAWLYLAVRKCVPFSVVNTPIGTATIETYTGSSLKPNQPSDRVVYEVSTAPQTGEAIWDAWEAALSDPNIGGQTGFIAPGYDAQDTVLEAATKMVQRFAAVYYQGNIEVFRDVTPDNWYYDGILYLTDRQYIIGYGDGQFGANDLAPRYEFAVLLTNVEGVTLPTEPGPGRIIEAIQYVVGKGYMTGSGQEETENWDPFADDYWTTTVTREEATVGILKMLEATEGIDTASDNLAILDRFTDRGQIASEASEPYLAYAVSMGLLNGTSSTTLSPNGETTRAQIGVLLYRTLIGVDASKMKDYADNTAYAIRPDTTLVYAVQPDTTLVRTYIAPLADTANTLTLREDWRLTSDLDLQVPAGTTLTIDGNGHYIYEMGGMLQNSGLGQVVFTAGTILYPAGESGPCTTETSNQLMAARQPHTVTVLPSNNGSITASAATAQMGQTVTLTVTPASGYRLETLTVTDGAGQAVTLNGDTFVMPASDVTITATFGVQSGGGSTGGGSTGGGSSSGGTASGNQTETTTNPDGSTTTTVTNPDGTVTETTQFTDGSKEVVETKKDGTVTTTTTDRTGNKTQVVENPDGSSWTTVTNVDGSGSVTEVTASGSVAAHVTLSEAAAAAGGTVTLPMPDVPVTTRWESAPTITVDLPGRHTVAIPVETPTSGTVAVLVGEDGTETVLQTSIPTENGVVVTLSDGDTVKIVDNSKRFTDVPVGYWGADAVNFAASRELFGGTSATTFSPDAAMTRAMFVTVLARLEGVDTDTGSTWYEAGQQWAMAHGISDGSNLDQALTREQLATMLYRYAGSPAISGSLSSNADGAAVSDWAKTAMIWAVEGGLITGTGSGLQPQGTATRAQVATILMRFLETHP